MSDDLLAFINDPTSLKISNIKDKKSYPDPTRIVVTLCVVTGTLNVPIKAQQLAKYLECNRIQLGHPGTGICKVKCGLIDRSGIPVSKRKTAKKAGKKNMSNSVNVIIVPKWYDVPTCISKINKIDVILFKNGNFRLTGPSSLEECQLVMEYLITKMLAISCCVRIGGADKWVSVINTPELLRPQILDISMYNSQFWLNFEINRDKLTQVVKKYYHIPVTYKTEKCQHRAVKICYFYNKLWKGHYTGICYCKCGGKKCAGIGKCNGKCDANSCNRPKKKNAKKGCGDGLNQCRIISCMVFCSGCVIISGARNKQQIYDGYRFMINLTRDHYHEIAL